MRILFPLNLHKRVRYVYATLRCLCLVRSLIAIYPDERRVPAPTTLYWRASATPRFNWLNAICLPAHGSPLRLPWRIHTTYCEKLNYDCLTFRYNCSLLSEGICDALKCELIDCQFVLNSSVCLRGRACDDILHSIWAHKIRVRVHCTCSSAFGNWYAWKCAPQTATRENKEREGESEVRMKPQTFNWIQRKTRIKKTTLNCVNSQHFEPTYMIFVLLNSFKFKIEVSFSRCLFNCILYLHKTISIISCENRLLWLF